MWYIFGPMIAFIVLVMLPGFSAVHYLDVKEARATKGGR